MSASSTFRRLARPPESWAVSLIPDGTPGPGQRVLGLRGEDTDKIERGRQVADEIDGLTRPHRLRREVAPRYTVLIRLPGAGVCGEVGFPSPPLVQERVAKGAGRVLRRPPGATGDVKHDAALGVLALPRNDRLLG